MIEADEHRWPVRVYYEDTDAGGIVYHASYLRFAERARTEALRALGAAHHEMLEQHGLIFVVRRIKVDYLSPAKLDEALVVGTCLRALGGASMTLHQAVRGAGGAERALLEVLVVCVRADTGRAARVPDRWRNALAAIAPAAV